MAKYRKKPVVIDAILWDGTATTFGLIQEMGCPFKPGEMGTKSFLIPTLEGDMKVTNGDWVIRGVKGEFYPCKPDIFEKTYELADESPIKEDGEDDKEICEFGEWANGLVYINEKYQNSSAIEFKNMKEALAFWREKIHRK